MTGKKVLQFPWFQFCVPIAANLQSTQEWFPLLWFFVLSPKVFIFYHNFISNHSNVLWKYKEL